MVVVGGGVWRVLASAPAGYRGAAVAEWPHGGSPTLPASPLPSLRGSRTQLSPESISVTAPLWG